MTCRGECVEVDKTGTQHTPNPAGVDPPVPLQCPSLPPPTFQCPTSAPPHLPPSGHHGRDVWQHNACRNHLEAHIRDVDDAAGHAHLAGFTGHLGGPGQARGGEGGGGSGVRIRGGGPGGMREGGPGGRRGGRTDQRDGWMEGMDGGDQKEMVGWGVLNRTKHYHRSSHPLSSPLPPP